MTTAETTVAAWNAEVMTIGEVQEYLNYEGTAFEFTYNGEQNSTPAIMKFADGSRAILANWEENNLPGIYKVHNGKVDYIEVKAGNDYTVHVYDADQYIGHFQYQYDERGLSDMLPAGLVREFYLSDIEVVKKFRGLGYGSVFLSFAKLLATQLGADGITLLVKSGMGAKEDAGLKEFYLFNQFEPFGPTQNRTMWFDLSKVI